MTSRPLAPEPQARAGSRHELTDYRTRLVTDLRDIGRDAWDALLALQPEATPFLRFDFLHALHASGSASPDTGWSPQYLTLWQDGPDGEVLAAAVPLYVKGHSYGEYGDLCTITRRDQLTGYPCHPQAETVDQIMRLWTGAREQVRANPYCLIPFLPWDNVDRFASVQHDVPQDDSRRLVGACVSAYIHNGRVLTNSISLRELRRRVAHRLGDTSLSDRAIARALECSSLRRDPGAPGNEVQLAGAGILKRALLQSLGVVDSHGKPAPAPRADIIFSEGLPAPLVEESLARQRPSSLHILSAFPRLISFASNCIHIHRAIGDSVPTSLATAEDVFVHRADCLDLTTLNKLVQRIGASPGNIRAPFVVPAIANVPVESRV